MCHSKLAVIIANLPRKLKFRQPRYPMIQAALEPVPEAHDPVVRPADKDPVAVEGEAVDNGVVLMTDSG